MGNSAGCTMTNYWHCLRMCLLSLAGGYSAVFADRLEVTRAVGHSNLGKSQWIGHLMVLSLGGLLFPIDRGLAIGPPNLEFSDFILLPVYFHVFGHEAVYIRVLA